MNTNNWVKDIWIPFLRLNLFFFKNTFHLGFWNKATSIDIIFCRKNALVPLLLISTSFLFLASCNQVKYTQGQRIYMTSCANCHMDDGSGLKDAIPSIHQSDFILGEKYRIVSLVVNGINADSLGVAEKYMPAHPKMTDTELNNLLNYLQEKFNKGLFEYNLNDVKAEMQKVK
jgi:hypothetical protein